MQKIFIVGSPGAGKTTLAKALSNKYHLPHFDLDDIRFPKKDIKRSDEQALPLVENLAKKPKWIIEGIYIDWVKSYLNKADLVIFLDTPFLVAVFRVIWRYLKEALKGHPRHGLISTLVLIKNMTLFHILSSQGEYVTRQKMVSTLAKCKNKVVIKNNQQAL